MIMKLFFWTFSLFVTSAICGCASSPSKNLETNQKDSRPVRASFSNNARQPAKKNKISIKNQSRSGVFCGDRDVSDDF